MTLGTFFNLGITKANPKEVICGLFPCYWLPLEDKCHRHFDLSNRFDLTERFIRLLECERMSTIFVYTRLLAFT